LLVSRKEQIIRNQTAKGQTAPAAKKENRKQKPDFRPSAWRFKIAETIKIDSFPLKMLSILIAFFYFGDFSIYPWFYLSCAVSTFTGKKSKFQFPARKLVIENMLSVITDDSSLPPGNFADTESSVILFPALRRRSCKIGSLRPQSPAAEQ
jgi:hypothetical protein